KPSLCHQPDDASKQADYKNRHRQYDYDPEPNAWQSGQLLGHRLAHDGGERRDGDVPSNVEGDLRTKRKSSAMQKEVCQSALANRTSEQATKRNIQSHYHNNTNGRH